MTRPVEYPVDYQAETKLFYELAEECSRLAQKDGFEPASISLEWNNRFTSRLGDARVTDYTSRTGRVRLSRPLWRRAPEFQRRETMIHEIAHVYADLQKRRAGHGPVWKLWMIRFGYSNPERCYSSTVVDRTGLKRKRKRYLFNCPSCNKEIKITPQLRSKWVKRNSVRICLACRGELPAQLAANGKLIEID